MTAVLDRVVGVLLIAAVAVDLFRTVLLPTSHGVVDRFLSALLWRGARALPERVRDGGRRACGPLSLVLTPGIWLLALLSGFALLYLPGVAALAYTPGIPFGRGPAEALYLSGTALTTVGFGDVVGTSDVVRALSLFEAAAGLGVLTATLGYLPAIYTLVSDLRSANESVADLGAEDLDVAAALLQVDGVPTLEGVRRDVLRSRQNLQRFPVLHTFHPDYGESVVALARGATGLWVAAHFVDDGDRPVDRHVTALGAALSRLADELERHGRPGGDQVDDGELFTQARPEGDAREVPADDLALLGRLRAVLDAYAASHGYPVRSVVPS